MKICIYMKKNNYNGPYLHRKKSMFVLGKKMTGLVKCILNLVKLDCRWLVNVTQAFMLKYHIQTCLNCLVNLPLSDNKVYLK